MRRITLAALFALVLALSLTAQAPKVAQPAMSEPAVSPDGTEIAFVSGGDIWTVPAAGGEARLLVAHPATESRPVYSPDGKWLAFVSTRTGNGDIYALQLATGEVRRLTWDDAPEQLDGWSRDGQWVYFSSTSHDISGMNDVYRVSIDGGTPMEVSADRYVAEFQSAASPDGKTLALVARGVAAGQWWRHGHSHLDESEIWLQHDGTASYEQLVTRGAKSLWPMWTPDGRALYYMSDRNGNENIWRLRLGGQPEQLTHFTNGRVLWPSLAANGKLLAFERDLGIWTMDPQSGQAKALKVELRGAPATIVAEHKRFNNEFSDLAVSPDGKKLAFTVHGEVFAASAKDGGDAVRVTNTLARESRLQWAPDSHRLAYISERGGRDRIYVYDFNSEQETQLTKGEEDEGAPRFSPDGKSLAFRRGLNQIVVYDFAGKKEKVVATGLFSRPDIDPRPFDWSPDSRYIAYLDRGTRAYTNLKLVAVTDGTAQPISFLANTFSGSPNFGRDGKYVLFETAQRTEGSKIARVDLVPHTPKFREDQFRELFKDERPGRPDDKTKSEPRKEDDAAAAKDTAGDEKKPAPKEATPRTDFVAEGIRNRLTLMNIGLDIGNPVISPDGKWLAFFGDTGGQSNVYIYSIDELAKDPPVAKQLSATAGRKSSLQFSGDSKELFYLDTGRIQHVALDSNNPRPIAVTAEMDVDFNREKVEAFDEGWRALRDNFWDGTMHGLDWQAMREQYAPRVAAARSSDELRRLINLMIGELNSSHMGTGAPMSERITSTGHLGLRFDRAAYERDGVFKITEVVGLSPAAIAGIKAGETLTSIDGTNLGRRTNLDEQLDYKIDKKITVGVASASGEARKITLKPVRGTTEKGLLYRDWVNCNREYVEKVSGGRLGYVHMFDMGQGSLDQLYVDLDTQNVARQGVVVDVRNNNGGFVNAYALDVLGRRGYMTMTPRNLTTPVPARSMLGQRSLELPTILVTNQHSLSDAEDFTEGYRTLGLGKVVGEPTGGWIVYTGGVSLLDGSTLRMPGTRIRAHDGTDMEMHPRPVDVRQMRPLGESYKGADSQLDVAIKELLGQIEGKPGPTQKTAGQ